MVIFFGRNAGYTLHTIIGSALQAAGETLVVQVAENVSIVSHKLYFSLPRPTVC